MKKSKDKRQAAYDLYVESSKNAKEVFKDVTKEDLTKMISIYVSFLASDEDGEKTLDVSLETLKQFSVLGIVTLTRMLYERFKNE